MIRILLFLFANNFFNLANYIMLTLLVYDIFINNRRKIFNIKSIAYVFLILASITYLFLSLYNKLEINISSFLLKFLCPLVLFYIGYSRGKQGYKIWSKDILIITLGTFMHGFLNIIKNRNINVLLIAGRQYHDIYGGVISGTLQNLTFVLSSGLLFYFIMYEKSKMIKIFGIIMVLLAGYGSIVNASRTILYIILIAFFICLFLHLILKYKIFKGMLYGIGVSFSLIFLSLLVFWLDMFKIQERFAKTALGQRNAAARASSSILKNVRWKYALDLLKMLPEYPLGNMPYDHYAHNLWIDIGKETGILPFIFYISFSILSVIQMVKFCLKNKHDTKKIIFVVGIFIPNIFVFFTEPIMQGSQLTFSIFCFIIGGLVAFKKK